MKLVKQDIGVWVNCADHLPGYVKKLYNITSDAVIRRVDNKSIIKEYFDSYGELWGLHNFEWLKPLKDVYVLTEDNKNKILSLLKKSL